MIITYSWLDQYKILATNTIQKYFGTYIKKRETLALASNIDQTLALASNIDQTLALNSKMDIEVAAP